MQVEKSQIQRIQLILQALSFYQGKTDGIWGPKTIEAKKRFEASPAFTPGIPNNGMPFADKPPYPAGITIDHLTGLLHHPVIDQHLRSAEQPSMQPPVGGEAVDVEDDSASEKQ